MSAYVGKELPEGIEKQSQAEKGLPPKKPLHAQAAKNILGITSEDTYKSGLSKWYKLKKEAEKLGDGGRQQLVILNHAWESICDLLP